jgi:hypothetical protein
MSDKDGTAAPERPDAPPDTKSASRWLSLLLVLMTGVSLVLVSYFIIAGDGRTSFFSVPGLVGLAIITTVGVVPLMSYLQRGELPFGLTSLTATPSTARNEDGDALDKHSILAISSKFDVVLAELQRALNELKEANSAGDSTTTQRAVDSPSQGALVTPTQVVIRAIDRNRARLLAEVDVLGRRINLNLIIGIVTTFLALVMLATLVLGVSATTTTEDGIDWEYVVPRLSLALFTEAFAFFFLRLYKSGLEDAKYYQNEISNIEMWALGAQIALESGKDRSVENAVQQLMHIERNFKLDKNQTTVGLERDKIESRTGSDALEAVIAALKK